MTIRHLPDFLKYGDKGVGLPRRSPHAHIGKGFPDLPARPLPATRDAYCAQEIAMLEWMAHVDAGRIG
ncbi:MAG: hypothetical protein ABI193_13405 [Minicystis sp.]